MSVSARIRAIPRRKLVLGGILALSILFCLLLVGAGLIALLVEAAPRSGHGLMGLAAAVKHVVAHHFHHPPHPANHK